MSKMSTPAQTGKITHQQIPLYQITYDRYPAGTQLAIINGSLGRIRIDVDWRKGAFRHCESTFDMHPLSVAVNALC